MAKTFTFTTVSNETIQVQVISKTTTPNGEVFIRGGQVGKPTEEQTLPVPPGNVFLAFNPTTRNFFWVRINTEDMQDDMVFLEPHNFEL